MQLSISHIRLFLSHSRNFILFTITAIFGAIISYYVNLSIDWSRNSQDTSISGRWISASCDRTNDGNGFIVFDKLDISVSFFNGIWMRNAIHYPYDYEGFGKIYESKYFYGTWHSLKKGANTKGAFSFTISPQGDYLTGSFTGADDGGEYTQCWVLGRDMKSLNRAFVMYKKQLFSVEKLKLGTPAK